MRKFDPMVIGIIVVIIIVLGGIIVAASFSSESTIPNYNKTDAERPKMELSERNFDFGKIKLSDIVTKEITIKNIGAKPLNLSNFTTSCGCTTIQVIYEDQKSPEFSLHQKITWQKDITVNTSATAIIKYEPKAMPVEGEVERTAYFKSNDPDNLDVEISVKAFVEK